MVYLIYLPTFTIQNQRFMWVKYTSFMDPLGILTASSRSNFQLPLPPVPTRQEKRFTSSRPDENRQLYQSGPTNHKLYSDENPCDIFISKCSTEVIHVYWKLVNG